MTDTPERSDATRIVCARARSEDAMREAEVDWRLVSEIVHGEVVKGYGPDCPMCQYTGASASCRRIHDAITRYLTLTPSPSPDLSARREAVVEAARKWKDSAAWRVCLIYAARMGVDPYGDENKHILALGLAAEVGELANLIVKGWRGDREDHSVAIVRELADIGIYLGHLAEVFGVDLDAAITAKSEERLARLDPP